MSVALEVARAALAGEPAWLVGGAVRDRLLGRDTDDVDLALEGDPRGAARRIAKASGGASFQLSHEFGGWRAVGPGHAWHVDLLPLRDGDLQADLAARDFTVNAMAEPLAGGEVVDPHGGAADLAARRLRMVSEDALRDDPLRTLRAVRFAVELGFEIEPATGAAVREHAPAIDAVSPERVFAELKRVVAAPRVRDGLALMEETGLLAAVLPELEALRGVEQSAYHHADVLGHTLEVLDAVVAMEADPEAVGLGGELAAPVAALLAEPLADELTRGTGQRFAALLHDAAKPQTRRELPGGRVTFVGHDSEGAELARGVLRRLRASERLAGYVAALTRHHLALGFLVHERPLSRRAIWRYLAATEPYSADVTLLTVADRLATRGRKAEPAIAAHLELAREVLEHAFALRDAGPQAALVPGDELAAELGIRPGPRLGELLRILAEDRYAGEIGTREEAVARARELLTAQPAGRGKPRRG
jgi:tRNA nucleotidyltransferase/poly(A) polymerase